MSTTEGPKVLPDGRSEQAGDALEVFETREVERTSLDEPAPAAAT